MITQKSGPRGHIIIERIILTSPSFSGSTPIPPSIQPSIGTSFLPIYTTESNSSKFRLSKFGNARTKLPEWVAGRNLLFLPQPFAADDGDDDDDDYSSSCGYGDRDGIDSTLA